MRASEYHGMVVAVVASDAENIEALGVVSVIVMVEVSDVVVACGELVVGAGLLSMAVVAELALVLVAVVALVVVVSVMASTVPESASDNPDIKPLSPETAVSPDDGAVVVDEETPL